MPPLQGTSSLFSVSSKTPLLFQSIQPAIFPAPSQVTLSVWVAPGAVRMPPFHKVVSMASSSSKMALLSSPWASALNICRPSASMRSPRRGALWSRYMVAWGCTPKASVVEATSPPCHLGWKSAPE